MKLGNSVMSELINYLGACGDGMWIAEWNKIRSLVATNLHNLINRNTLMYIRERIQPIKLEL
jgi:hypothetical protein